MAAITVNLRLRDSESDASLGVFTFIIPDGQTLAQAQNMVNNAIDIVEACIGGYVELADGLLSFSTASSAGGPTPSGVYNERGAVFLFSTTGVRNESVRLPQILATKMTGSDVSLLDAEIAAMLAMFTTGISNGTGPIKPLTPFGYEFDTALRGRKSGRKWK